MSPLVRPCPLLLCDRCVIRCIQNKNSLKMYVLKRMDINVPGKVANFKFATLPGTFIDCCVGLKDKGTTNLERPLNIDPQGFKPVSSRGEILLCCNVYNKSLLPWELSMNIQGQHHVRAFTQPLWHS